MTIKRKLAAMVILGAGAGLIGCKTPAGGFALFGSKKDTAVASASPDVGQQRYAGLSQEFSSSGRPLGSSPKPTENEGTLSTAWSSTTASISSMFASQSKEASTPDATRLDSPSKKVGPEVHIAAARLLENQAKFTEAQGQYEKALKISPKDQNALVGLARLHDRQGQGAKAMELYQRALKAHPKSALVHNDLGLCYARQKQLEASLASISQAVQLAPDNAKYRNNLATVLVEAGRTDEALAQLSLTCSEAVAYYNVGFLLQKRGQTESAVQHMQQALALDPSLTPAQDMLAQWGALPGATDDTRFAAQPQFDEGSRYRTGVPAQPVSTQVPSENGSAGSGAYHIGDSEEATESPYDMNYDTSDESSRLPPVE